MNEQQRKKVLDSWKGKRNNAQGHFFEGFIKTACAVYKQKGIACVEKMPEPFMVLEKRDIARFRPCRKLVHCAAPPFPTKPEGRLCGGPIFPHNILVRVGSSASTKSPSWVISRALEAAYSAGCFSAPSRKASVSSSEMRMASMSSWRRVVWR